MDTPIYIDTYFRVESGYDGGRMPEEKAGRFFDEVKRLFTETGFSIKENRLSRGVSRKDMPVLSSPIVIGPCS